MKKLKNSNGFSVIHVLLVIIIIGITSFTGWFVWNSNQENDKTLEATNTSDTPKATQVKPETEEDKYVIPEGYIGYDNKDLAFKFAYPAAYGELKASTASSDEQIFATNKPNPAYIEGSSEAIHMSTSAADVVFYTYKYGPTLKFVDGEPIVQEVNPADEINRVGEKYQSRADSKGTIKTVGGLKVYSFAGGDEGSSAYRYAFLSKDKLVIITLPQFYDGTAICPEANCTANDISKYDTLAETILNSISKL
jgi:hypothetical protein